MSNDYLFGNHYAAEPPVTNDDFFRLLGDINGDGERNGVDVNDVIDRRAKETQFCQAVRYTENDAWFQ